MNILKDILRERKINESNKLKRVVTREGVLRSKHFYTWADSIEKELNYKPMLVVWLREIADFLKEEE